MTHSLFHFDLPSSVSSVTSVACVDTALEPDWSFSTHAHPDALQILFLSEGSCTVFVDQQKHPLHTGDVLLLDPGIPHEEHADPSGRMLLISVNVSAENAPSIPLVPADRAPVLSSGEDTELFRQLFLLLLRLAEDISQQSFDYRSASLITETTGLLLSLIEKKLDTLPEREAVPDDLLIDRVLSYLDNNYPRTVSLQELAEEFFFSPHHLARRFKQYTGTTVRNHQVSRRVGEAEKLLIYTDRSIREIAGSCGFRDIHYFYSVFKKQTGVTPLEFRRSYGQKKG